MGEPISVSGLMATVSQWWKFGAVVATVTAWLITWNYRVTDHENLTQVHSVQADKRASETVRLLRAICRQGAKTENEQTACNKGEDD